MPFFLETQEERTDCTSSHHSLQAWLERQDTKSKLHCNWFPVRDERTVREIREWEKICERNCHLHFLYGNEELHEETNILRVSFLAFVTQDERIPFHSRSAADCIDFLVSFSVIHRWCTTAWKPQKISSCRDNNCEFIPSDCRLRYECVSSSDSLLMYESWKVCLFYTQLEAERNGIQSQANNNNDRKVIRGRM